MFRRLVGAFDKVALFAACVLVVALLGCVMLGVITRTIGDPLIWTDALRVHVVAFTDSAIRLNVMAWFQTQDYVEFLMIRHTMLLQFMHVVERHQSSFAFPSRTVYHVTPPEKSGVTGMTTAPSLTE